MSRPLAIDFDGVLASTCGTKRAWLRRELGLSTDLRLDRSTIEPVIGAVAYEKMQNSVGFEDTLDAKPISGAVEAVRRLANTYLVRIVTARSAEKIFWVSKWLDENGLGDLVESVDSSGESSKMHLAHMMGAVCLVDNDVRHYRQGCGPMFILFGHKAQSFEAADLRRADSWPNVCFLLGKQRKHGSEWTTPDFSDTTKRGQSSHGGVRWKSVDDSQQSSSTGRKRCQSHFLARLHHLSNSDTVFDDTVFDETHISIAEEPLRWRNTRYA